MPLVSVYLGLGTNQGDKRKNLETALEELDRAFGCHYAAVSSIIETESWGFEAENFLNAAVRYRLRCPRGLSMEDFGLSILDTVKSIETRMGRQENMEYAVDGRRVYHSRIIDIDILFMANAAVNHERLQVPHPLAGQRDFVLLPLKEVATRSLQRHFPEYFKK